MKIGFTGIDLDEGKVKYIDDVLLALADKIDPKKVTPYFVEFLKDEYIQSDVIAIKKDSILDLLILDIEMLENRLTRAEESSEQDLIKKCLDLLESETPLCDADFNENEMEILHVLAPHSFKPVVVLDEVPPINDIIKKALLKSQTIFFYTAGKSEVHAWPVKMGSDIVTCAGKIHTDLARGFIKADIVSFDDFMNCHNMNDAKSSGVAKVVDKDYIIQESDIIEIRFNV
jgi:ribosome-binding ATPase YchF (GTP1/OBG family)